MNKTLLVGLGLATASVALADPPRYQVHILPGIGGDVGRGLSVNSSGTVVGQATHPGQTYEVAVAWINGQPVELTGSGFSLAAANCINDSGVVVGTSDSLGAKAFRAVPPSVPAAVIPQLPNTYSNGLAINAAGDITGTFSNFTRPFVIRAGVMTQLPVLGGYQGYPESISRTGIIVGWTNLDSNGGNVGVRWINDQPTQLVGGSSVTIAYGVNDEGWAVGYSSGPPLTTYEASLWTSPTTRINLGTLGSWNNIAYAINNSRQIVGASNGRGFLWESGVMRDLNAMVQLPVGYTITDARSITDSGLIAGQVTQGSQSYAVLLTPTCSADFNHDGDVGTDADIEAFFACLAGNCCASCGSADFNADGDSGTDVDIESFFRVLAGGSC